MGMPSMPELLIILTIIVLLFGAKKIPDLAKGIGSGIKNFKKALSDDDAESVSEKKSEKIENETTSTAAEAKVEEKTKA